jgi:Cytochrome P460
VNRFTWMLCNACLWLAALPAFSADTAMPYDKARFTPTGELLRPENYREWVQIGSGIGMVYGPVRDKIPAGSQAFTNVFVNPSSYRGFLASGAWPDRTVFILEIRSSQAVNKAPGGANGLFQGEILGLEAEVKDEARFPGKWGFFGLSPDEPDGQRIPTAASCYSCHAQNAAVENTFTQFYPVLRDVAKRKGTFRQVAEVF